MLMSFQRKQLIKFVTNKSQTGALTKQQELQLKSLEKEMLDSKPLEYIVNRCDFLGCDLFVNQDVLIPRVETEILCETVINKINEQDFAPAVLDLCSGSGAIGLSIKKNTSSSVTLVDVCSKALSVAKKNAHQNNLDVTFIQSDLFKNIGGRQFDIVVCNPPYISSSDYESLDRSVKNFEPKKALVGGETGLEFYERISKNIEFFLKPGAKLYFEIGFDQQDSVKKIFSSPNFTNCCVKKDYSGHDRFFFLEFQPLQEVF